MSDPVQLVWFRQDLRLTDHRALRAAIATGAPVLPVYILDDETPGPWAIASASRWWLHHSLTELTRALAGIGAPLVFRRGTFSAELVKLVKETGATAVFCSRSYEPWAVALENDLKAKLTKAGAELKRYPGTLLREPEDLRTKTGGPFKVYTPFWNALSGGDDPAKPQPAPTQITPPAKLPKSDALASWKLLPTKPDWSGGMRESWQPGEAGAEQRLEAFLDAIVSGYADSRNRPDKVGTSRLSPHLHFGEISPCRVWHALMHHARGNSLDKGAETYLKEIVWREFSYHLLFHFPDLPEKPFRPEFAAYPWKNQKANLTAWQRGQTGYPIVDAGMRELWHTGWMHNRVRMIVASFLIKHLLISWQQGQTWFWDTLVDADLANNAASWQWVAGSGADAAPYFRIFNPMKQGTTFDPKGEYVRRWVPELAALSDEDLNTPWEAAPAALAKAGVVLGKNYPHPIVDHAEARKAALAGYAAVRDSH
ncbi:MAG: deoxyribodipyrimidine photo-lyase [Hyphomicrobiaceae bacterium]|nr:deoxyribodipyrimidine photo-lyase [Hyphomicrobiaceae bacterium]